MPLTKPLTNPLGKPVTKPVAASRPVKARRAAPRSQADRREATIAQILDAAEKLFARHGRDGVTVRALAQEASVDAPLVHYYFGDMDGVFRAMFYRKSEVINAIRNNAMDQYLREHGEHPSIEGALEVFLRPVFLTITGDPKYWSNFAAIVSHTNSSHFRGRELMREAFDTTVQRFIDLLKRLAPSAAPQDIYWYYHLLSGSLSLTLAQSGRIDSLSAGLCQSTQMMAAYEAMVKVYSLGFEAVKPQAAKPAPAKAQRPNKAGR